MAGLAGGSLPLAQAPFVHPGIAAAAVAAALLPLIIHLISRRRYRRVPWAAMSFLLAATRRTARRLRFEHFLLLLVRTAIVLVFGLALARPFMSTATIARAAGAAGHRIIVLDNSLSMSAHRSDARTRFSAAQRYAVDLLDEFAAGDAVSIVSMAAPAERLLTHPSHDRRLARERILSLEASDKATDFSGGVAEAIELVEEWQGPPGTQTVYVISDFSARRRSDDAKGGVEQASSVEAEALGGLLDERLRGRVQNVVLVSADSETRSNAGVVSLTLDQQVAVRSAPQPLAAAVHNAGPSMLSGATLQILDGGEVVRREEVPALAAGRTHRTRMSIAFRSPGIHLLEARLVRSEGDALAADDARYLSVEVVDSLRAVLVDGRSAKQPLEGESGYLATALSPASRMEPSDGSSIVAEDVIESTIVASSELAAGLLDRFDVIALCNVEQLSSDQWDQLARYVVAGGGVIWFLGDRVNVENYNGLGYREGGGILPAELRTAVSVSEGEGQEPLRFSADNLRHPMVSEFADNPTSGLFAARVGQYFPVKVANDAEAVLSYTNGDAALLTRSAGRGRVVLYTTTANMSWNTLPAKGDYVSLMRAAVAYVARVRGGHRNLVVGQPIGERLAATEVQLSHQALGPDGKSLAPTVEQEGGGLALSLSSTHRAGIYEISVGDSVRPFAVNPEPDECDLSARAAPSLCAPFGNACRWTTVDAETPAAEGSPAVEISAISLLLVCGLLLSELWLATRFGFSRGGDA